MTVPVNLDDWNPTSAQRRVRDAVAEIFDVPPYMLIGRGRARPLVHYRHTAMWVIRQCFPHMSYPMIGRLFGGRDHSTVIHGCRNVDHRRTRDQAFAALTDSMVEGLGGQPGGIEVTPEQRERVTNICEQLRTEGQANGTVTPDRRGPGDASPRAVLPRNDFSGDDRDGEARSTGSAALLAAMQREGMVCR